jgi:glycosyltransferase involved in cell wall biosynthesis
MRKIAIVHDHLLEFGGAERVLVALKQIFPEADVYVSLLDRKRLGVHAGQIADWKIHTSWADRVPLFKRLFSPLRFLWPLIWESFDFSNYDLVISSSGTMMSKGIITRPQIPHICYLHHPPRNLYYYETAMEWQKCWPIRIYGHIVNHHLRIFDYLSSRRVDHFIANSEETLQRIRKFYRMDGSVIYPPVTVPHEIPARADNPSYYLSVSRLARAKHIEVLIHAANKARFPLKVIGTGRDEEYLRSVAGPTVEIIGSIRDEEFTELFANAKAFLFASVDEEFGIAPIEAMGRGVPVIAYASGGLKETVKPGKNGYLYHELSPDSLITEINKLESLSRAEYEQMSKIAHDEAQQYSFESFKKQMLALVKKVLPE